MVKPANGKFNEGLGKKEPLSNELLSKKKNRLIWRKVAESVLLIWHAEEQRAQGKFSFILKIKQYFRNMIEPGPGILLIADPFLKDPNFLRTVVLLCDHKEEGSFGFVLNKQIEQTLDELLNNFDGFKLPVYYGGAGTN
ncbi:MAG: YqgE/AlgH family protein [Ferruginibacter sp.]